MHSLTSRFKSFFSSWSPVRSRSFRSIRTKMRNLKFLAHALARENVTTGFVARLHTAKGLRVDSTGGAGTGTLVGVITEELRRRPSSDAATAALNMVIGGGLLNSPCPGGKDPIAEGDKFVSKVDIMMGLCVMVFGLVADICIIL
jgi:hypothetical protein